MILDHVDNLKLPDDDRDRFHNELRSLSYLSLGLSYLANQVGSVEKDILERLPESSSFFILWRRSRSGRRAARPNCL